MKKCRNIGEYITMSHDDMSMVSISLQKQKHGKNFFKNIRVNIFRIGIIYG